MAAAGAGSSTRGAELELSPDAALELSLPAFSWDALDAIRVCAELENAAMDEEDGDERDGDEKDGDEKGAGETDETGGACA